MKNKKIIIAVLCAVMLVGASVLGTLAWLTDTTGEVKNTFTVGNIDIELTESDNLDLKMVPGRELAKDPKVIVKKDSEACWLFVKIDKSDNYDTYLDGYVVADGWTALTGVNGVYYREVAATTEDTGFYVLADAVSATSDVGTYGSVKVKDTVTKALMDALYYTEGDNAGEVNTSLLPTLTFTAYAVQKDGVASAAYAWTLATE